MPINEFKRDLPERGRVYAGVSPCGWEEALDWASYNPTFRDSIHTKCSCEVSVLGTRRGMRFTLHKDNLHTVIVSRVDCVFEPC
jgi:hypothetical protein